MDSQNSVSEAVSRASIRGILFASLPSLMKQWMIADRVELPSHQPPPPGCLSEGDGMQDPQRRAGESLVALLQLCDRRPQGVDDSARHFHNAMCAAVTSATTVLLRRQGLDAAAVKKMLNVEAGADLLDDRYAKALYEAICNLWPVLGNDIVSQKLGILMGLEVFISALAAVLSEVLTRVSRGATAPAALRMAATAFAAARAAGIALRPSGTSPAGDDTTAGEQLAATLDALADGLVYALRRHDARHDPQRGGQAPQLHEALRTLLSAGPGDLAAGAVATAQQLIELQGQVARPGADLLARLYVGGSVLPTEEQLADNAAVLGNALIVDLGIDARFAQQMLTNLAQHRPGIVRRYAAQWLQQAGPFKSPADANPNGLEVALRCGAVIHAVVGLSGVDLARAADAERCCALYQSAQRLFAQASRESTVPTQSSKAPQHFEMAAEMLQKFAAIYRRLVAVADAANVDHADPVDDARGRRASRPGGDGNGSSARATGDK